MYELLCLVSVTYLFVLLMMFKNNVSVCYVLLNSSIIVLCLGYMQISKATTTESAIFANETVYLGSCSAVLFMLLTIAELCKTKIPRYIIAIGVIIGLTIIIFTCTVNETQLYYKSFDIATKNGYTYIKKEYGPMHSLYTIFVAAGALYGMFLILEAIIKKKQVSKLSGVSTFIIMALVAAVYIAERVYDWEYEYLPAAYVIGFGIILYKLDTIKRYDINKISALSRLEDGRFASVVFDSRGHFAGCDDLAKEWFPELADFEVDYGIYRQDTEFSGQLQKWLKDSKTEQVVFFDTNDKIIEARHLIVNERKGFWIHCVQLKDDTEQQKYNRLIKEFKDKLEEEVERKTERLTTVQEDITLSMASIVENRDNNTGGHIKRTSDVIKIFSRYLIDSEECPEMDEKKAERIIKAATLHDFGKIAIPDRILNKPGKFDADEYEEMKKHAAKGAIIVGRILQNVEDEEFKKLAVNVAHYHHEKWDGSGYPMGKRGEEIPFEARVMALADVFDALVSKRVYKDQFTFDKAFSIIEESSGTHFDPVLCSEFLECRGRLEDLYNSYEE